MEVPGAMRRSMIEKNFFGKNYLFLALLSESVHSPLNLNNIVNMTTPDGHKSVLLNIKSS